MQPFHVQRLLRMKAADTTGLGAQTLWGPPRARSGSLFGKAPSLCMAVTFLENANKTTLTLKILRNVHSVKLWVQNSQNAIRYPPGSFLMSMLSPVWLCVTPWTVAHQAPLSLGFSRHGYCSGLPCPSPGGNLPDPRIEPGSSALTGRSFTVSATREALSSIWYAFKLLWRGHLSLHFTCALI